MNEVSSNAKVQKGSMFYKLIQRAFPGWFKYNSIYLWQPMYTPKANKGYAKEQKKDQLLVNDGPSQPREPSVITDYDTLLTILQHYELFKNPGFTELEKLEAGSVKDFLKTIDKIVRGVGTNTLVKVANEHGDIDKLLSDYFSEMAKVIERRERCTWVPRNGGKTKTYQIDMTRG